MFEKEAEEYTKKNFCGCCPLTWKNQCKNFVNCGYHDCWKDGAEFGYNKANEWHYPSKGEYPSNHNDVYLLRLEDDNGHTEYEIGSLGSDRRWTCEEFGIRVIAWKEIVLPELKESD